MAVYKTTTNEDSGIIRDLTLTVNNNTASLSEPVTIYRGDRGIELHIRIQQFKFRFGRKNVEDVVDDTIVAARALITGPHHKEHLGTIVKPGSDANNADQPDYNPDLPTIEEQVKGTCFEVPARKLADNLIVIDINDDWVNEVQEVGTHTIQIQLYGKLMSNGKYERLTIPPVTFQVLEPICEFEESIDLGDAEGSDESKTYGFDESTNTYLPYEFKTGDTIPFDALNGMEDALVYTTTGLKKEVYDKFDERLADFKEYVDWEIHDGIMTSEAVVNARITEEVKTLNKSMNDATKILQENINALDKKHTDDNASTDDKFKALNTTILGLDTKFTKATSENSGRINNLEYDIHTEELDSKFKPIGLKKRIEVAEQNIITVQENAIELANEARENAIKASKEYTDGKIDKEVADRNVRCDELQNAINNEVSRSTEAERVLGETLTNTIIRLEAEEKLRKSSDDALGIRIDSTEKSISDEIASRTSADNALQTAISTEVTDRTNADNSLQASIDTEITNRTQSDIAIYQAIEMSNNNITANATAIAKEVSDREGAISALDEKHTGLNNALRLEIDGNIKTAIDELETTIDNDIKTKLDELDKEIDTEIKTSIDTLGNSVYTKEEVDETIAWLQENIRGPQGTSILRYRGVLNSKEELIDLPQIEGDTYFIGAKVYVCNGPDGPLPIWDEVELRGPQGYWYTPHVTEGIDENGYKQTLLSWSNNAPEGSLDNPDTLNIKGDPIKFHYGDEPEDKNMLWVVEAEQEEYATKDYVDKRNFIKCNSCQHVEFVTEYPLEMEEGVLYILIDPVQ